MRNKKNYRFNHETLQFEEIKTPLWKKSVIYALGLSVLVMYALLVWNLMTPANIKSYLSEKSRLLSGIKKSDKTLEKMAGELNHLKEKDDNIYRASLDLAKIDESTWIGGSGGSIKNPELEKLRDGKALVKLSQKIHNIKHQLILVAESQEMLVNKAGMDEKKMRAVPAIRPLLYLDRPLSQMSGFGMRRDPINKSVWQMHPGIDMGAAQGTPIFATGDGVVVRVEYKTSGYGLNVIVDHGYGYKTLYAHMSKIEAKPGQKVKRGQLLGLVGSTGYSTSPHVHYEVFLHDNRIDPVPFIANMTNEEYKDLVKSVDPNINFSPRFTGSRRYR
jgi:murein DD-endopeptidase MepM/ murein hydrolase activator NlpD